MSRTRFVRASRWPLRQKPRPVPNAVLKSPWQKSLPSSSAEEHGMLTLLLWVLIPALIVLAGLLIGCGSAPRTEAAVLIVTVAINSQ